MAAYPDELKYTAEHEWVGPPTAEGVVRIGITDYAQESLGDIVYVALPQAGAEVKAGDPFGEVESTKSVSDVYAPVAGVVVARNEQLDTQPELVNTDPYGEGWILELRVAAAGDLDGLLDASAYRALAEGETEPSS